MTGDARAREWQGLEPLLPLLVLVSFFWLLPTAAGAADIVFLEGGRTIQADRVQFFGDRVHIEEGARTIQVDRSAVLSIHRLSRPTAFPSEVPPAEVYRDLTRQMTDKVRREMREQLSAPRER